MVRFYTWKKSSFPSTRSTRSTKTSKRANLETLWTFFSHAGPVVALKEWKNQQVFRLKWKGSRLVKILFAKVGAPFHDLVRLICLCQTPLRTWIDALSFLRVLTKKTPASRPCQKCLTKNLGWTASNRFATNPNTVCICRQKQGNIY